MIEQTRNIYDLSGNMVSATSYQRLDGDTTTGELTASSAYATASVSWYDKSNRPVASASYGRETGTGTRYVFATDGSLIDTDADGIPDEAEAAPRQPDSSDDYIVSATQYDDAGRGYRSIDNAGRIVESRYDLLGRTTAMIENYEDGAVVETEADTDRTTVYVYDSSGRLSIQRAKDPKGSGNGVELQDTRYLYESSFNGSLNTSTIYPDSADTDSSGTDQVKVTYDRLGRMATRTDQRGVVHSYSYDSAGRLQADAVTSLSGIVDDSILRIERAYDDIGRLATLSSFDAATGGDVVNQIAYEYDGWGNVATSQQAHDGAVTTGTPAVEYAYADGAVDGDAKYVRLSSVTYPNGRVVKYGYGSAGSADDLLSRVYRITDAAASEVYARYSYLGDGTIVAVEHPEVQGGLTLSYDPDGDHSYGGWDRFGRVVEQSWRADDETLLDGFTYTYDRSSNRLTRTNALNDDFSEAYTYDGLDRLTDADRDGVNLQSWDLDQLGNWDQTMRGTVAETRTHNAANEITAVNGDGSLADSDAAGNMVVFLQADGTGTLSASYDAWNRLTGLADGANAVAAYEYDGANRRIQKVVGEDATDFYWNEDWQLVEERLNDDADPLNQTIYDLRYIDAPAVRFHDGNTDGDLLDLVDNTLYPTSDANFNITGVVDAATGSVPERYAYAPYGQRTVLNGDFSVDGDNSSDYDISQGHQGLSHDAESGLVYNRNRFLAPAQGRFLQRDPVGYRDGENVYQYVRSNPVKFRDWNGLEAAASQPGACHCGPDVTAFLVDLINGAAKWRLKQGAISRARGLAWLKENGTNLDWWSTLGPYKTQNCPSGKECKNTYWLCGECVHDHWIGNFMYGFLGRLLRLPDRLMNAGGNYAQGSGISDPPWDTAGYGLGRIMFDELSNPKGKQEVCEILKSNVELWNAANNTAVVPFSGIDLYVYWINTTPNWPRPHASGYKGCNKCPEDLPAAARNTIPGGKLGNAFPDVK